MSSFFFLFQHGYATGEEKSSRMCVLFTRWGRIGDQGQCQRTPFASLAEAKDEFAKLFKQKTGNDFADTVLERKRPFESKPRRYTLVRLELRRRPKLADIAFELFEAAGPRRDEEEVFAKSKLAAGGDDYRLFWADLLDVDYLKRRIHQSAVISSTYLPLSYIKRL